MRGLSGVRGTESPPSQHQHTTHLPVCSLVFIASPNSRIFGWPLTDTIMSQTSIKASLVHVLCRQSCRISFCCLGSSVLEILSRTPRGIMFLYRSSHTTVFASMSAMNWSRKSPRTCLAAWKGGPWFTPTTLSCLL